jgi:hypothetical protein
MVVAAASGYDQHKAGSFNKESNRKSKEVSITRYSEK